MSKTSLNKKAARQLIIERRREGKPDAEIYRELTQTYYDKKGVAQLITGTPTDERKAKYKTLNNLLLVLLIVSALLKILWVTGISLSNRQPLFLLLVLIVPLLNIYFTYEVSRMSAPAYRSLGIVSSYSVFQLMRNIELMTTLDVILNLVLAAGLISLAFYLDAKLFPNFRPQNMKPDQNGDYTVS